MAAPTLHTLISPRVRLSVDQVVVVGDLIGWDSTNGRWTKADADTASLYAQWVVTEDSVSSGMFHLAYMSKEAIIEDLDAPFTQAGKIYLSSTAGAWTHTRVIATSTPRLSQVVGYALDTFKGHFQLPAMLTEIYGFQQFTQFTAGALFGLTALDSGIYGGTALDANADTAQLTVSVPDKAVSLAAAHLFFSEEAEASTITLAISVASALHATAHDLVTADTTITAYDIAANAVPDDINKLNIDTSFDAANIIRPGALLSVRCRVALGGTDVNFMWGIEFVWNCVP